MKDSRKKELQMCVVSIRWKPRAPHIYRPDASSNMQYQTWIRNRILCRQDTNVRTCCTYIVKLILQLLTNNSPLLPDILMVSYKQRQERIQEDKASTEANIAHNGPKTTKEIYSWRDGKKEHRSNRAHKGKREQQFLAVTAVVCCSGHCYDKQRLEQDTDGESVHREASGVDFAAEDFKYALRPSVVRFPVSSRDFDAFRFTWLAAITSQYRSCRASRQILKRNGDESSKAAYHKDLGGERIGIKA